jgi:hypothetical protein
MPLFTDGPPSTIEDLTAQDSQLQEVASVEGIDVTQKLALAWHEMGLELQKLLNLPGTRELALWNPGADLGAVVATAPLKLWHTYRTLEMIYQDAYNSQLNDRYAGRRDQYREQARAALERFRAVGIGFTAVPVSRAGKPIVSAAGGAALGEGTYYVAMAWVNGNGEEGAAGDPVDISIAGGTVAAQAGSPPANATGWNVYAGSDPNVLTLQNVRPLEPGETWLQPAPLAQGGRAAGKGQEAGWFKPAPRVIPRG